MLANEKHQFHFYFLHFIIILLSFVFMFIMNLFINLLLLLFIYILCIFRLTLFCINVWPVPLVRFKSFFFIFEGKIRKSRVTINSVIDFDLKNLLSYCTVSVSVSIDRLNQTYFNWSLLMEETLSDVFYFETHSIIECKYFRIFFGSSLIQISGTVGHK